MKMDREELTQCIAEGPILIRMNDGRSYEVPSPEMIVVSDISATVLCRSESDGKLRSVRLPLVTMSAVEELQI